MWFIFWSLHTVRGRLIFLAKEILFRKACLNFKLWNSKNSWIWVLIRIIMTNNDQSVDENRVFHDESAIESANHWPIAFIEWNRELELYSRNELFNLQVCVCALNRNVIQMLGKRRSYYFSEWFKSIQVDSRSQAWSGNNKLQGWTVGDSPRASIKLVANLRKWGILSDLSWEELVPASFRSNRPVDRALFLRIRVRVTRRDSYSNLWKRLIVCLN